jgi:hypothetical protein
LLFPLRKEEAMCRSVLSALLLLALVLPVGAAPAPFFTQRKPRPLSRSCLIGTWDANWGGVRCRITLSASGDYSCEWCGTRYIGSWRLDPDGRVWISESCRPDEQYSWQAYAIRLLPDTLAGPIESGAKGVFVRLERARGR